MGIVLLFLFIFSLFFSQYCCAEVYNITSSRPLVEGQTLASPGHLFELGFFGSNSKRYVGLWHKDIFPRKVVWVANRGSPLAVSNTSASLRIDSNGNLKIVDGKQNSVWSTNITTILVSSSNNTAASVVALLLDNGNFVLQNDVGDEVWQSFDYPTDTILPSMLLGFDSKSGSTKFLTAWKSESDPLAGKFVVELTPQTPTQVFVSISNGSTPYWRSGPWDKTKFIGVPDMNDRYESGFRLEENEILGTKYFSYSIPGKALSFFGISSEGVVNFMLSENGSNWNPDWESLKNPCDRYGACGPFGVCSASESPMCNCLETFVPRSDEEWSKGNWTGGCVRKSELSCMQSENNQSVSSGGNDEFKKIVRLKVPDFHEYVTSLEEDTSEDCKMYCLHNCTCIAYGYVNNIGCLVWSKALIDMQEFSAGGSEIYIRIAQAEQGQGKKIKLIVSLTAICFIGILASLVFGFHRLRATKRGNIRVTRKHFEPTATILSSTDTPQEYMRDSDPSELFICNFDCIVIATNNFSITNKLGEGGFGPVYKGKLQDGNEIAVKRLSSKSGQGTEEFKNEMLLIYKLQHKNLVKIMGYCIKDDEKLLIYEFMPNKSLDTFLFDPTRRAVLDWGRRFNIIQGVARGLLYLHHDSCLKVIHRDLKVSNILLDEKMNPKISDFGLARIVQGAQNLVNTQKIVGTFGYMSPEYAMGGIFSEKSDVYSFGVLLLEIISGRKNTSFYYNEQQLGFLAYAWHLWSEGRGLDLADEVLTNSHTSSELLRCLHIGLLCVQDNAADRPTMPDVVFMLKSITDGPQMNSCSRALCEYLSANQPKQPMFTFQNSDPRAHYVNTCSTNEATVTMIEEGRDTLSATESLGNGQTLVSAGEVFELGFFRPGREERWYLGVWYKKIEHMTVVWVANRDSPLLNNSSILKLFHDGNLVLQDHNGKTSWTTNQTDPGIKSPVVQLLDSGNVVIKAASETDPNKFLWQSFDHPTDTLLPEMKLGWNRTTGFNRYLTSWKSKEDPSSGEFSFKLDYKGFPEIFLRSRDTIRYRSGPWNGERFSGVPEMKNTNVGITFEFVETVDQVYYSFSEQSQTKQELLYSRLIVTHSGEIQRLTWRENDKIWNQFWYAPKDQCDRYRECGPYGVCDSNASPVCECMRGFRPRNEGAWDLRDGSEGCVRDTELQCEKDKFLKVKSVKLPESGGAAVDMEMGLEACKVMCLGNCSCSGYASARIENGGKGCVMWFGELMDVRSYAEGGQDLYIRLVASELDGAGKTKQILMIVGIVIGVAILLSAGLIICFVMRRRRRRRRKLGSNRLLERRDTKGAQERSQDFLLNSVVISSKKEHYSGETSNDDVELPLFDFNLVAAATDNFSDGNKLGRGGFGCVYKGLVEGEEIAVKRLSKNSGQGTEEFKNEVKLIARLQHRNLVRLLGCCVDTQEKMLIYEYMENKSLDSILFDKAKKSLLDWQKRFDIICGIARGLLYLHQDSRFRIIHRDLKASNILLDGEMNPKISDFGMARIFGQDQTEANTKKVVGTYGYMSPEYAMDGNFSIKSDVFSFGVLVLEIVSGQKNRGFYYSNNELNLLGHAWQLWNEGHGIDIVDSSVGNSYSESEVLRCMQVGLLCVQERAEDRPTMSSVVLMLSSETASLPQPKNPGFCLGRKPETESSSSKQDESVNQVTVTILDPR